MYAKYSSLPHHNFLSAALQALRLKSRLLTSPLGVTDTAAGGSGNLGYFGYRGNILTCAAQGRTANFHAAPPHSLAREIRNPEAEKCFFPIPLSCLSLLFLF